MIGHALFSSDMNWVEKRWLIEQNLVNGSVEVWNSVSTALDNACQTLKQHYSESSDITYEPQNGHRIVIKVNRKRVPVGIQSYDPRVDIQIIYERIENRISVIVGHNKSPKHFPIQSDETHAFLSHGGKEISPDEFSKLVLEDAFFKVRELSGSHSGNASSWMG
jgi:hypothetical protein